MIKMYAEPRKGGTKSTTSEATKQIIRNLGRKAGRRGAGVGTINPALRGAGTRN